MAVYFSYHQKEILAHKYKIPHTLYQSLNINEHATRMQTPVKLKIVSNDNKIKMQNNSYCTYVFKKKL
jgi:hypothetical protein